jgi:hypothetical protein
MTKSTGILNAIRYDCHQLSYKNECFHRCKNGEEKALIQNSESVLIFIHLPNISRVPTICLPLFWGLRL